MLKLAIIFGGKSTEHDISIVSGTSIIYNLDKNKYRIFPIYLGLDGVFYKYSKKIENINPFKIGEHPTEIKPIKNIIKYLEKIDIVFPVLHGKYGEDGTIQGMLELLGKKYVGCKVLASSICMDKIYTKTILRACNIEQAKSMYIKKESNNYIYIDYNFNKELLTKNNLSNKVKKYLNYPVFIKPSNLGSSIGINKASNDNELFEYIEEAFRYDTKVLIEETIIGREVECAVFGNNKLITSCIGEVLSAESFYSYDSKYNNKESKTTIPASLPKNTEKKIQDIAKKAYLACDCQGLSRIDFFIEKDTNRIVLNEINTMPGFTEISMYPKLMEQVGYNYSRLLDILIKLAIDS